MADLGDRCSSNLGHPIFRLPGHDKYCDRSTSFDHFLAHLRSDRADTEKKRKILLAGSAGDCCDNSLSWLWMVSGSSCL